MRIARTHTQPWVASYAAIFTRTYAVASSPAIYSARTAPKVAPRANTYVTAAEVEAEYTARATENGSPANSAPSSTTAQIPAEGVDPFAPASLDAPSGSMIDWSKSYHGLGAQPFPKEAADVLLAPIDPLDIEMKPGAPILLRQHEVPIS